MTVEMALAYCQMNDHKAPGEVAIQGDMDREAMRVLWQEVLRLRQLLAQGT